MNDKQKLAGLILRHLTVLGKDSQQGVFSKAATLYPDNVNGRINLNADLSSVLFWLEQEDYIRPLIIPANDTKPGTQDYYITMAGRSAATRLSA